MNLGLRVLCYNCNLGRQNNGGTCPHQADLIKYERSRKDMPPLMENLVEAMPSMPLFDEW